MVKILNCLPLQKPVIDIASISLLSDSARKLEDLKDISNIVQNFRLIKPEIDISNPHDKVNTILSSWDGATNNLQDNLSSILTSLLELNNITDIESRLHNIQEYIKSALESVEKIEGKLLSLSNANVGGLENYSDQVSILKWLVQFIDANIALDLEQYDSACRTFDKLTNPSGNGFRLVKQFLSNPDTISSNALLSIINRNLPDIILEKVELYKIESYTKAFIVSLSEKGKPIKINHLMSEYLEKSFSVMKSTADGFQSGNNVNPKLYKPLLDSLSSNYGSKIALDLGREMIRLGDYDDALECINMAGKNHGLTDMNRLDILYNLSIIYLHQENYQQILNETSNLDLGAKSDAESCLYGHLLCVRGYAHDVLGDKDNSIESFIKALDYLTSDDSIYKYVLDFISSTSKFDDVTKEEISSAANVNSLQIILYEQIYAEVISSFRQECYRGNLEGIKSLIDNNKSILGFGKLVNSPQTLFYIINGIATSQEKKDIMLYLKEKSFLDLNINNGFALEMAVQKDDIYLVQFLMNNDVKMRDYEDGILLFYAVQRNDYDMFFLLKNSGIKLDDELLEEIKSLEIMGALKDFVDGYTCV